MYDFAEEERKAAIKKMSAFVDSHEDRLAEAKRKLGDKWLLSPNYNGHYVPELTRKSK